MLRKIILRLIGKFRFIFFKIFSLFIKPRKNQILFYPNLVSFSQLIDIQNYTHECVLTLLHHLITDKKALQNKKYEYVLAIYQDYQKEIPIPVKADGSPLYKQVFCPVKKEFSLSYLHKLITYYRTYFSSHIIITGDPLGVEKLKKKGQIEFDISYYVQFKSDYLRHPTKKSNIDYLISGSKIASQIDSLASNVPYERYVPLGLPKWENLLKPRYSKETMFGYLGFKNFDSRIILYTPTHRDYERKEDTHRGFLGENRDYDDLNKLLQENKAYLIVKPHSIQNLNVIKNIKEYSNIKFYQVTREYTLYDIMPWSDLLITDYTSTYFDWLVLSKPTLFYWYDREKYEQTRGLSWEPVENVCVGNIAYTYDELVSNIDMFLSGRYPLDEKKLDFVKSLVLGNNDTPGICEKIYDFICTHS